MVERTAGTAAPYGRTVRVLAQATHFLAFGELPLRKITPSLVRSWNAQLAWKYPITAAKAYRLLNGILNTAVADELIGRNPCVVKGAAQERSPERPMVSIAEVNALTAAMPERWRIAI